MKLLPGPISLTVQGLLVQHKKGQNCLTAFRDPIHTQWKLKEQTRDSNVVLVLTRRRLPLARQWHVIERFAHEVVIRALLKEDLKSSLQFVMPGRL